MIKNNFESNTSTYELFPVSGKQVELSFSGDTISSDGGLLLLREVENQINIIDNLSQCLTDNRDQRYIDHTIKEMLTQRIFQIASGYEDCNDCDELRNDMIFKTCAGRLPQSGKPLASQPTMSRLENSLDSKSLYRMESLFLDTFISSYDKQPEVIILDCDDTNTDTYGQQELTLFNQYYQNHCYMPLHIYEGLSGKLVTTILKPRRRSKQSNIASLLKKLINHIRKDWPDTMIIVRGDSHFTSADFMQWCDTKYKIGYITGVSGHKKLHENAKVTIDSAEREFKKYGKFVKRYHSFFYQAGSWHKPQKIVVKVEVSDLGTNIRYIVTNQVDFKAKGLYEKGYCARCGMELRIKEHKLYLKSDRASCSSFKANQFRLFLHSAAYILLHTFQKEVLKNTQFENSTFKTIQNKIIKTAAWVKELKTKVKIELPKSCPSKQIQSNCFEMFSLLRT
ncbi:IS1380 family transposase [Plebeiibacterium sediminum]|uniref:IS1380 family transposase n=1 Tax=Plebeiibacterium sediminum TaxID=2992112 RepID=A0AAE3M512_9BACT|nr:IS1380 family transposase [Plebeiobacterium sediminum]MCW3786950.1 IS1380 family transposase [Plebeiobacterium sediminum]